MSSANRGRGHGMGWDRDWRDERDHDRRRERDRDRGGYNSEGHTSRSHDRQNDSDSSRGRHHAPDKSKGYTKRERDSSASYDTRDTRASHRSYHDKEKDHQQDSIRRNDEWNQRRSPVIWSRDSDHDRDRESSRDHDYDRDRKHRKRESNKRRSDDHYRHDDYSDRAHGTDGDHDRDRDRRSDRTNSYKDKNTHRHLGDSSTDHRYERSYDQERRSSRGNSYNEGDRYHHNNYNDTEHASERSYDQYHGKSREYNHNDDDRRRHRDYSSREHEIDDHDYRSSSRSSHREDERYSHRDSHGRGHRNDRDYEHDRRAGQGKDHKDEYRRHYRAYKDKDYDSEHDYDNEFRPRNDKNWEYRDSSKGNESRRKYNHLHNEKPQIYNVPDSGNSVRDTRGNEKGWRTISGPAENEGGVQFKGSWRDALKNNVEVVQVENEQSQDRNNAQKNDLPRSQGHWSRALKNSDSKSQFPNNESAATELSSSFQTEYREKTYNKDAPCIKDVVDDENDFESWESGSVDLYNLDLKIGVGTYGEVYKASRKSTGQIVALKKIKMDHEKEGFPITAMREIKVLRLLQHKSVVRLKGMLTDPESKDRKKYKSSVYMIFEYMEHDLAGLLENGLRRHNIDLSLDHKRVFMKQLLEGLAYCHGLNIMHRDIKSANILISNSGQLKIADFGLARIYEDTRERPYTNHVITLWYRPPELLLGETRYKPSIDLWSAGCILGEFFERKPVFRADRGDELGQIHCIASIFGWPTEKTWPGVESLPYYKKMVPKNKYFPRFRERFRDLPDDALDLMEKLLSMDPKNRPTAREALKHNFVTSFHGDINASNFDLKLNQDCHELWSKRIRKKAEQNR